MFKQINSKVSKYSAAMLYCLLATFCLFFLNASSQHFSAENSKVDHHTAKVTSQNNVTFSLLDICEEDSDNEEEDSDDNKLLHHLSAVAFEASNTSVSLKTLSSTHHFSFSKRYLVFSILRI